VDKVIGEFAQRGIKPADLEKAISSYRASAIWGLDSIEGKVSQLAMGQVLAQDPDYVFKNLDAIARVKGLTSRLPTTSSSRTSLPWC
jgi:zinc protease